MAKEPVEKVEVFIPRGMPNDDPNYYVSVNGENFLLPRGQKSVVPAYIADEIRRAEKAEDHYYKAASQMASAAQASAAAANIT